MIFADKKFSNPIKIIEAFDNQSLKEAFDEIERCKRDFYLLGYVRYEAKDVFLGKEIKSDLPLLYFEVFKDCEEFVPEKMAYEAQSLAMTPAISYEDYRKSLEKIKNQIALGNTYQVNYTYDWLVETPQDGFELYQQILANQTTPYNAYIKNRYEEILSFSPELFFEINNDSITTKPMKGTIKRGKTQEEDTQNIEFLQNDAKTQAENVMIVDLLRNDLSQISKAGTVKVDELFNIETHKTVHQMTSQISAELRPNISFYEIFEAIFPCGSVTGAPKINTMEIINNVELGKRDVYCGAIGLISPQKTVFSVPIRILQKKNDEKHYRCRVGGGIVWDSDIFEEWQETHTKIRFLRSLQLEFQLVETIKIENAELFLGDLHFKRLQNSAKELGFKFNPDILKIKPEKDGILRILLSHNGDFEVQYLPLKETGTNKVILSKTPVNSGEELLQHKTTYRPWYDLSMKKIKNGDVYDEIFMNERGELTEGARSNILLEIDGVFYTPPLSCGLLNGVFRQKMLEEKKCVEKILYISDLKKAQNIYCINSVREMKHVDVDFEE